MKQNVRLTAFQALSTICFILMGLYCTGQNHSDTFNPDSSKSVSISTFNRIVDNSITLLQTKKLAEISDTDHINIMMCLNTIFMINQRFTGGSYQKLVSICDRKKYAMNIIKVYPNWIQSVGCYQGDAGVYPLFQRKERGIIYFYDFDWRACCLSLIFGLPCYQVGIGRLE